METKYAVLKYQDEMLQYTWKDGMTKESADNLAEYLNSEAKKQFGHLNIKFVVVEMN